MNVKPALAILKLSCWWFRQLSGDAAYENYLRSASRAAETNPATLVSARHPESAPAEGEPLFASAPARLMTREEFFLDSLLRRYSTISRCC